MSSSRTSLSARTLFSGVVFLCALCLFVWFGYATLQMNGQAQTDGTALAQQTTTENLLEQAAQTAQDTGPQRTALAALVIPQGGTADFLSQVESAGSVAGVKTHVSSVVGSVPHSFIPGRLNLTVQFTGNFSSCQRFIQLVETLPIALSVMSAAIQEEGTSGTWDGTLTLSAVSLDSSS